jgi:hypothetical protein
MPRIYSSIRGYTAHLEPSSLSLANEWLKSLKNVAWDVVIEEITRE